MESSYTKTKDRTTTHNEKGELQVKVVFVLFMLFGQGHPVGEYEDYSQCERAKNQNILISGEDFECVIVKKN